MYSRSMIKNLRYVSLFKPRNIKFPQSHKMPLNKTYLNSPDLKKFKEGFVNIETMMSSCKYISAQQPIVQFISMIESLKQNSPSAIPSQLEDFLKKAYNYQGICYMKCGSLELAKLAPESFENALSIDSNYIEAAKNLEKYKYDFGVIMPELLCRR